MKLAYGKTGNWNKKGKKNAFFFFFIDYPMHRMYILIMFCCNKDADKVGGQNTARNQRSDKKQTSVIVIDLPKVKM